MPHEQELDQNSGEMNDLTEVEKKVLSKFDKFVMPQMALLVLCTHFSLQQRFDYVYVENVALGHLLLEEKMQTIPEKVCGQAFNISNREPITRYCFISSLL